MIDSESGVPGHGRKRPDRSATGRPLLEMRSITKRFPGVIALADVSLTVQAGEIHAICAAAG